MVLGSRRKDDVGEILVYRSSDLKDWKLANRVTSETPFGYMWEAPRGGKAQFYICTGGQCSLPVTE